MAEEVQWERPKSVPYPQVWRRYVSTRPMANGKVPIFKIQDYTEEYKDQVLDCMTSFFLRDEPLSKSLNIKLNKSACHEFVALITKFLEQKMVLIATVENLKELGDENLPSLAGCNITGVVTEKDKHSLGDMGKIQKILTLLDYMEEEVKPFQHYQVSEYLYAVGLAVNPVYRGHGLGCEILKARFPLCKAVGLKVTVTVFTAIHAQNAAEKAGFELLKEVVCAEYKGKNGKPVFNPDITKSIKLMGKRIT